MRQKQFNAITAAVAAIAIAAALLSELHSQAYADSPPPTAARASQPSDDASRTLRRYTLQLLHILSNPNANKWERYRQAMPHCAVAPTYLDEIGADSEVSPLDATLIALAEDLCSDLDQRLEDARTVGLLVNEPESIAGYTLMPGTFNKSNDIHLIDHLGRIAHSWQLGNRMRHARLLDNGNLLIMINQDDGRNGIAEVDSNGNVIWKYTHPEPDQLHHDFLKMPNGNVLMLAVGRKTRQEAIAAGANPPIVPSGGIQYDYLIEVRPTGNEDGEIVWKWSTWDYLAQDFDASKENYREIAKHPELIDINFLVETPRITPRRTWDWLHANAIDYNPALDQIMLSARHHSELWIISRSATAEDAAARGSANAGNSITPRLNVLHSEPNANADKGGALLYRWGNPRAYGHGTLADQRLFWQHHTQWIAPGLPGAGNILVFNNGWALEEDHARHYSSIEEIVPPLDGYGYRRDPGAAYLPADPIWSYTAETPADFYSVVMGGTQRLPNGNTLICDSTSGNLLQVTPDGRTVWRYVYPMDNDTPLKQGEQASTRAQLSKGDTLFSNVIHRAYWYAPDHPGLQNYDLTPGDTIEIYE